VALTPDHVERFMDGRIDAGRAPATVNRYLETLRAALRSEGLPVPKFDRFSERENVRKGFFEPKEFDALAAVLPVTIADAALFAYLSGWRKGEIVSLTWEQVDRKGREVRLYDSKNGEPRTLPFEAGEPIEALIERRWQARQYETANGTAISALVFHDRGRGLGDFRKAWQSACVKVGLGRFVGKTETKPGRYVGKLFHDLRRTAVRDMVRGGVPQSIAMRVSGHETDEIFRRYDITSADDKLEALRRMSAYRKALANRPDDAVRLPIGEHGQNTDNLSAVDAEVRGTRSRN
jgi:integrase